MPLIDPRVIVTADDFGRDAAANHSIRRSFSEGLVSHASLMANMPGFEDACAIAHGDGFVERVGLHFNLTSGTPLTAAMRDVRAFCRHGRFRLPGACGRLTPLSAAARRAVADEARAQIRAARARGIALSHLDSHNDMHIEPSVAGIVIAVAGESGITRVRPSRNCGSNRGFIRRVQHGAFNAWLSRTGLRRVRYFGTLDDLLWLAAQGRLPGDLSVEIMTHPSPGPDGTVLDAPSLVPLAERLRALDPYLNAPKLAPIGRPA
jgi:predicted glycoside hydrolase/deacetylase ChbG (UPF0249 family)